MPHPPAANSATCSSPAPPCSCRASPTRSPRAWWPTADLPPPTSPAPASPTRFLGIPDNGLVTLTELADHVAAIRDVFPGPLMVDADTGFGNALNMRRTIQVLERAGADAIQIEDQVFPKRCGHFEGKEVIPAAEMVAKIKAAVDARTDPDLMIVARTDAIAVEGFDAGDGPRARVPRGRRRRRLRRGADHARADRGDRQAAVAAARQHRDRRQDAGTAERQAAASWASPACSTPTPRCRRRCSACSARSRT